MASLTKDRLIFDPADLAESDNLGAYVRAGSDGDLVSSTNVGGKEGLDVNVINTSIVVSATDLDIRDLVYTQDSVTAYQGTSPWVVGDGGGSLTVDATDLDIRDLTHVSDSVKVGDGTDFLAINADGSINTVPAGTYLEDTAHVSGDRGGFMLAVRNDAETSLVSADGDYAPLQVSSTGRLKVDADLSVTNSFEKAEDSAHASGDIGAYMLGVRQDTLASSTSADGDYGSIKTNDRGATWTVPVGTVADDAVDTENPVKIGSRAVSGALTAVSATGDRANVISDLYRRVFINDSPNISVASAAVAVDNVAEVALPTSALAGRRRMMIQNLGANDIYVGPTGLTTASGMRVAKGSTLALEIGQNVSLYAISGNASASDVRVFELA